MFKQNNPDSKSPDAQNHFAAAQAGFVYRHARLILIGIALLTAAALPLAGRLRLHANFMDLLPAKTPSITSLKELNSHVGGSSYLIAVVESEDEKTARVAAEQLAAKAAAHPGVGYVNNRTSVPELEDRKLLFLTLDSLKKLKKDLLDAIGYYRRKANPFYIDLMGEEIPAIDFKSYEAEEKVTSIGGFSLKGKDVFMQVVLIKPRHPLSDFEKSEKLFADVRAEFAEVTKELGSRASASLSLTGPYKVRYDEYRTITGDLRRTGIISLSLVGLIILIGFRSLRSIFYIYLPLGIVLLWTSAFAFLAIGYLNLISGFLFAILLGLGIDYAIHLRIALQHSFQESGDMEAAVKNAYSEVGKPIFMSCITTALAFFSMTISPFEGLKHFGIIAGAGIFLSFVVVFYGIPSLMTVVEKYFPEKRKPVPPKPKMHRMLGPVIAVLVLSVVFSIYSLLQVRNLKFDYNFANLQAEDEGIVLAQRVYDYFGIELTPAAFMTPNRARAVEWAGWINDYIKKHPESPLDFAASVMSHVPKQQPEKIQLLQQIDAEIETRQALLPKLNPDLRRQIEDLRKQLKATELQLEGLPLGMRQQYEGGDGSVSVVFVFPKKSILDGQVAKQFVKELRSLPAPADVTLAGEPVIYADILALLERDTPRSLLLSLFMVVIVLFINFKRLSHVLWVLVPVALAFLWMIGMTGAIGFKYNYLNIAILVSVLGAGIDNGIYIYSCYRQKRGRSFIDSVWNTGKGVILSSATSIAAFASLIWARHTGMASMGKLGVIAFLSSFLSSVVILPALIQFFEARPHLLLRWAFFRKPGSKKAEPAKTA